MTKGDLVHIPQSSQLMQVDPTKTFIMNEVVTDKPTPAVYVATEKLNGQNICKIYLNSDYWFVYEKNVYPFQERTFRRNHAQ